MRLLINIIVILIFNFTLCCGNNEGVTEMMIAARSGNNKELLKSISKGDDINATSKFGWTALMFAAWQGHEDCVATLLKAGANPNVNSKPIPPAFETTSGYPPSTALAESIQHHHFSIANTLIDGGAVIDPYALSLASSEGSLDLLKKMQSKGANFNQPSRNAFNPFPLCTASREGRLEIVKWLVINGANPNLLISEETALTCAIEGEHAEIVRYLLDNGAQPNIRIGYWKRNALYMAVLQGPKSGNYDDYLTIIEGLLLHGADDKQKALELAKEEKTNSNIIKEPKDFLRNVSEDHLNYLAYIDSVIELLEN
jgi:ankyrin repeat protein